ncbi:deubiquitination-protection protein dph1 [Phyllosticta capitalensis]|uniref:Deubiquitination-protection protein dph1 n=1 Tax=Phyllosticta capitalensis TaxID=121624 RepID=A0ABR1YGN0_9PEZI
MADDAAGAEEQVTFNVKSSNEAKYTLTVPRSTTVADLKAKLSTSEYADTPADRQRLIYSGRVLKDPDTLDRYKIKDGHTVHMVKSAASNVRQNPSSQGSSTTVPGAGQRSNVPTNIATGTGHDPLAGLTGARYAGLMGLPGANAFGPDGGMGAPPNTDEILQRLEDPNTVQMMTEALNNPIVLQQMRNSPMFRDNPVMQQMLDNPAFRRIMTDPEIIRAQLRMTREMRGAGAGGEGGSFPAPGVTNTTPQQQNNPSDTASNNAGAQGANPQANPFSLFGAPPFGAAGGNAQANPFAALFGAPPPAPGAGTGDNQNQTENRGQNTQSPPPNPFAGLFGPAGGDPTNPPAGSDPNLQNMMQNMMANPEAMRAAMQMLGGGGGFPGANSGADGNDAAAAAGAGANPFASLFGPGGGAAGAFDNPLSPPDNRPPEERYADQLRQLNDMGFYEFERNIQALRRSGGSVQGAVEYLLSGP